MIPTPLIIILGILAFSIVILVTRTFLSNIHNAIDNMTTVRMCNRTPPLSEREVSMSIV